MRPLTNMELHTQSCISFIPDRPQLTIDQRSFTFDYAFSPAADQHQVYDTSVMPLLHKFLEGYNSTILAYG